jgi:hypothetical protein
MALPPCPRLARRPAPASGQCCGEVDAAGRVLRKGDAGISTSRPAPSRRGGVRGRAGQGAGGGPAEVRPASARSLSRRASSRHCGRTSLSNRGQLRWCSRGQRGRRCGAAISTSWCVRTSRSQELGLDSVTFHDLRHGGNVLAGRSGVTARDLIARMGHDSIQAAITYQHASPDAGARIAASLRPRSPARARGRVMRQRFVRRREPDLRMVDPCRSSSHCRLRSTASVTARQDNRTYGELGGSVESRAGE